MASIQDDSMMNATMVSNLPTPVISSMNDNRSKQSASSTSSYQDLIKHIDIKQMSSKPPMQMPAQMQQQMPKQLPMQMPAQMQQQMPKQLPMQTPPQSSIQEPQQVFEQQTPDSVMESLHAQSTTYSGTMPQSAPIGEFPPYPGMNISQGPVINSLLPDPMFFNPPPRQRKRRREPSSPVQVPSQASGNISGNKFPSMDLNKIKPAILVAGIVFALLSWGAPVVAKKLTWTVDAITGKFTSSGLIIISLLTGGIYLGISEIIRNYGNGV